MPKIKEKILKNCSVSSCKADRLNLLSFRTRVVLFYIILCCCGFLQVIPALGNTIIKEDILSAIEKKYAGKSFSADFTQTSRLAALEITEKASGRAFFSHPGKMRWEYIKPVPHEIITNGKSLWIYRPRENQVMQGDASRFFKSGAGGAFLSDISLIRKKYNINIKEITADYMEIDLVAKKKNTDISYIVIRVLKKTDKITRVVTYNPYDDTTMFEFTHIKFNKINPDIFEFKIPAGVDIIDMD